MTTLPVPMQHVADGRTSFGVWPVPGPASWQALTLSCKPDGGTVEGRVEGQVVVRVPKPWGQRNSSSWGACTVEGHEVVVYAESWDLGETVRCDVFVDGYSLTTREPTSVIPQRAAAIVTSRSRGPRWAQPGFRSRPGRSRGYDLILALGVGEIVALAAHARSVIGAGLVGAAIMVGNSGIVLAGQHAARFVRGRGWPPSRVRAAEMGIVACGVVAVVAVLFAAALMANNV